MAQTYSDKKGNQHPTYAAARMANVTIDAADEAKKHTKLLENQNVALADQARQQAKAQKRQNELAEESLELERERAAEEAEHRGKLERIEQERLQSDRDYARYQRDLMVLESATDEERLEFFVNLDREDDPSFWNNLSVAHLLAQFRKNPGLASAYHRAYHAMEEKAKSVADVLNEFRSLKGKTDAATRVLGLFSLLFYLGTACFMTNCSINKALLDRRTEDGEIIKAWGEGYFIVLLILIICGLWFFLKNSDSIRNLREMDKNQSRLKTLDQSHDDPQKIQMDFEQFAQENVDERKKLVWDTLATVQRPECPPEERQAIAEGVRGVLKDRMKDYPRRCRPSVDYLNDDERLFFMFALNCAKADLLTLECAVAYEYSIQNEVLEKVADVTGKSVDSLKLSSVGFVRIGYMPKMGENFLKGAGYVVAA